MACFPGLQGDHGRGPALYRDVLVDQWAAAAGAHRGQGRDLLLQGEIERPRGFVCFMLHFYPSLGTRWWQRLTGKTKLSSLLHHQRPEWRLWKEDRVRKRWVQSEIYIYIFVVRCPLPPFTKLHWVTSRHNKLFSLLLKNWLEAVEKNCGPSARAGIFSLAKWGHFCKILF